MNHPVHPMFTHFPIALWLVSLIWDFLALWRGDSFWWSFAFWSIALGLTISFLTIVTGLVDYVKMPRKHPEESIAMKHMGIVIAAAVMFTGSFFARMGAGTPTGTRLYTAMGFSIGGSILLVVGAWYGGELVHKYGVGRVTARETQKKDSIEK
jgi:uncharacterized membrane protein